MAFVNPPGWQPPVSQTKFFLPGLVETTVPSPGAVLSMGWFEPWLQPFSALSNNQNGGETWAPFNPTPPVPTPTQFGWYQPFSPPPPQLWFTPGTETWAPFNPTPPVATPTQFGFFEPFSQPILPLRATEGFETWVAFLPPSAALTPTQFGFFVEWLDPVRVPAQLNTGVISWAPFNPVPPVPTPAQFGFYQPFSTPVSALQPLQIAMGWVPSVPGAGPPPNVQNYVNTGAHNFVSQDMGSGIEF